MSENNKISDGKITLLLSRAPRSVFVIIAGLAAFTTYFSVYAFRKPFQAGSYEELTLWGFGLKTILVSSQLIGYTISKYLGIKICSEIKPKQRLTALFILIGIAQLSLVLFAVLPLKLKVASIFLNGLPLGMIWGVVVLYLEGRRMTEVLIACLSCSYIISSGIVKDFGLWIMRSFGVGEFWMPAVTGLCFLPLFAGAVWLLNQLPAPTKNDQIQRTFRKPMSGQEKKTFIKTYWIGIAMHLVLYFFLTAFRDFRDSFGIEILQGLGLDGKTAIFTRMELLVAFAAVGALMILNLFDAKRYGVLANIGIQVIGVALIGVTTVLFSNESVNGFVWMVAVGMGGYLMYIPSDTVFYERVIASTGFAGTAVFMSYVMDAFGYTGAIGLQFFKEIFAPEASRLAFFQSYCYFMTGLGIVLLAGKAVYFYVKMHRTGIDDLQSSE